MSVRMNSGLTCATVCRCRSNFGTKIFACWSGSYKAQRSSTSILQSTSVLSMRRLCAPTSRKRGQLPTRTRVCSASTTTTRQSCKQKSSGPYLFQTTNPRDCKTLVGKKWDECEIYSDRLHISCDLVLYITAWVMFGHIFISQHYVAPCIMFFLVNFRHLVAIRSYRCESILEIISSKHIRSCFIERNQYTTDIQQFIQWYNCVVLRYE